MDWSSLPDANKSSLTENAIEYTQLRCPSNFYISFPDSTSHNLTEVSLLPDAINYPFGQNTIDYTHPKWPSNFDNSLPDFESHILID